MEGLIQRGPYVQAAGHDLSPGPVWGRGREEWHRVPNPSLTPDIEEVSSSGGMKERPSVAEHLSTHTGTMPDPAATKGGSASLGQGLASQEHWFHS